MSTIAGANCKFVPLRPHENLNNTGFKSSSNWKWDENELERAFSEKTRLIIINSPNNPLGKVYTRKELEKIAELCIKFNTLCFSDEVYEHICYKEKHIRIGKVMLLNLFE